MSFWNRLMGVPSRAQAAENNRMVDEVEASGGYLGRLVRLPKDWDGGLRWWHCQRCGVAVQGGNRELHTRWHADHE